MTYKCLGDGVNPDSRLYKITFTYFVLCGEFDDDEFALTLFEGLDEQIGIPTTYLDSSIVIENPEFPCLVSDPDICVEQKIYSFEIELPVSLNSYFCIFQTCCRTVDIINILYSNPIGNGNTTYVEITPLAQQMYNSSPEFNVYPPTAICNETPFSIDLSATDSDGHQLVYEFHNPFDWSFEDYSNWPADPPPYPIVNFGIPEYSFLNPLGQGGLTNFNSTTGLFTGAPSGVGKYLIGISIKEYENGQLLGTVFRDFQINVVPCTPQVHAEVEADYQIGNDTFVINICNTGELNILNESYIQDSINDFYWTIDNNIYNEWNPSVVFNESGQYAGQLILNPGQLCNDTANLKIYVNTSIDAQFSATYDTCIGGAVEFINNSISGFEDLLYFWDFYDSNNSTEVSPLHYYEQPGAYNVKLEVTDAYGCSDSLFKMITWLPAPPIIVIAPEAFSGCIPADIRFNNLSWPIDSTYSITWDFGDDIQSAEINASHVFRDFGVYDISLSISSPIGCTIDTVFSSLIEIYDNPIADFSFIPDKPTKINSTVDFFNMSTSGQQYYWYFNSDQLGADIPNPSYTFSDTGTYEITLQVWDENLCSDTLTKFLRIDPNATVFFPNAFTPNGDGINEVFKAAGIFDGVESFHLVIFNRYGAKVFEANDPNIGWNGTAHNSGKVVSQGVYTYMVDFTDFNGQVNRMSGFLTLLK